MIKDIKPPTKLLKMQLPFLSTWHFATNNVLKILYAPNYATLNCFKSALERKTAHKIFMIFTNKLELSLLDHHVFTGDDDEWILSKFVDVAHKLFDIWQVCFAFIFYFHILIKGPSNFHHRRFCAVYFRSFS